MIASLSTENPIIDINKKKIKLFITIGKYPSLTVNLITRVGVRKLFKDMTPPLQTFASKAS